MRFGSCWPPTPTVGMSERPRRGDIVCAASGTVYRVTQLDLDTVQAERIGRRGRRTFALRDLECVDPDDGVWAEVPEDFVRNKFE